MKLLKIFLLLWWCTDYTNAYIYPLCSQAGKNPCNNYFVLPEWLSSSEQEEQIGTEPNDEEQHIKDIMLETLKNVFYPLRNFFREIVIPYIRKLQVQIFPDLIKEERKAKYDNNLYVLFIFGSMTTYLVWSLHLFYKLHRPNAKGNVNKFFRYYIVTSQGNCTSITK